MCNACILIPTDYDDVTEVQLAVFIRWCLACVSVPNVIRVSFVFQVTVYNHTTTATHNGMYTLYTLYNKRARLMGTKNSLFLYV